MRVLSQTYCEFKLYRHSRLDQYHCIGPTQPIFTECLIQCFNSWICTAISSRVSLWANLLAVLMRLSMRNKIGVQVVPYCSNMHITQQLNSLAYLHNYCWTTDRWFESQSKLVSTACIVIVNKKYERRRHYILMEAVTLMNANAFQVQREQID